MVKDISSYSNKGEAFEAADDVPVNCSTAPTFGDVVNARLGRRDVLRGALAVSALAVVASPAVLVSRAAEAAVSRYIFEEISHGVDETDHVPVGYSKNILIRWGDPLTAGAPDFDPMNQTAATQEQQFGYNNDYVGFVSLPEGSNSSDHGLLCVNHEYTNEEVMFPGIGGRQDGDMGFADMTKELVDIEMAAHGGSIVEIKRGDEGKWSYVKDSSFNRRLTMLSTEMALTGPAGGSDRLKTSADATGSRVIGMINNCAGGITPWGTYLSGEENFHGYFLGEVADGPEKANHERYGVPGGWYTWGTYHDRFDVGKEPNESNRFGWVVETDPYDPNSMPKKRTALGRFKHEGAESLVNKDGRVVVYMGDDQRFEYVYKFVTEGRYDPDNRAANMDLLDSGTLSVGKFNEDGTMNWLPLVFGTGPITAENGFNSQADVVIGVRFAADLLGATPMDRPEGFEPNKITNKVYVNLTNNSKRKADQLNVANPRAESLFGHTVEFTPPDGDHAADTFEWEILILSGDPNDPDVGAKWNDATTENGWFASQDNVAIDHQGRLWIASDQGSNWSKTGTADGIWALEAEGELRGTGKMFYRVPVGAEMCGPLFTPDDTTMFVAVQHPATDGTKDYPGFERASTFEDPATRWPDFDDNMPVRPAVVTITKDGGGKIAT